MPLFTSIYVNSFSLLLIFSMLPKVSSYTVSDLIILFDICSRGYLQVWTTNTQGQPIAKKDLPSGMKLLSLDEGRSYEVC